MFCCVSKELPLCLKPDLLGLSKHSYKKVKIFISESLGIFFFFFLVESLTILLHQIKPQVTGSFFDSVLNLHNINFLDLIRIYHTRTHTESWVSITDKFLKASLVKIKISFRSSSKYRKIYIETRPLIMVILLIYIDQIWVFVSSSLSEHVWNTTYEGQS